MTSRSSRFRGLLATAGAVVLALPGAARAAEEEECPTWLPDFRCERSGRYEGFERPIMAPFMFEDPFITTGIYPYYMWHEFPRRSALGGGDVHALAIQARVALTDRLAFIATKDGRVWEDPDNPLLSDQKGFLNLAGGFKYALIHRPEQRFIVSPALRLEWSTGSSDIFEGGSGGILIPSVSAAKGIGRWQWIGGLGGHVPLDGGRYSSLAFYHLYLDYALAERLQPFVQLSGIRYIESGDGTRQIRLRNGARIELGDAQEALGLGDFEGVDLHNLGSEGVDGNDFVSLAVGSHLPITRHVTLSVAYERPLTDRDDIFKQRVMTSLRLEY